MSRTVRLAIVVGLFAVAVVVTYTIHPHPGWPGQDPTYHDFADQRTLLGVPNFWNVVTNLPFLFVGLAGLALAARRRDRAFTVVFLGVALTCFGSGYYHLWPSNATLFWDRTPMTVVFMPLFAIILGERIDARLTRWLLVPLLLVGLMSVVHWHHRDDLRPYTLVQFYPLLAIPVILILFPSSVPRGRDYWGVIAWYVLAKVLEVGDRPIYAALRGEMSGHALKHLAAAMATYWIYRMLRLRGVEGHDG